MNLRTKLFLGASVAMFAGWGGAASAQTSAAGAEASTGQLEELVVTARRREETLQSVPTAVTALSGNALEKQGVKELKNLTQSVPGLMINQAGGAQPTISIRGDFNRVGAVEPGVGVFIDGVYQNRYTQISHGPVDAARLEVVKGPQSTLYGKNTIGGAIGIVTHDPTDDAEALAEVGYGASINGDNLWHAQLIASGPIVADKLLARLVIHHQERDGYLHDPVTDLRSGGYDATTIRGKLIWRITPDLEAKLILNWYDDNAPRGEVLVNDAPRTGIPGINPTLVRPFQLSDSPFDWQADQKSFTKVRAKSAALQLNWTTPIGAVQSSTSYQVSKVNQLGDSDSTRYPIITQGFIDDDETFQQDLRLVGGTGPWTYTGGLYYLNDNNGPFAVISNFGPDAAVFAAGVAGQYNSLQASGKTYAVYGQVGYDITEDLNVTGGLRWARDTKDAPLTLYTFLRTGALAPGALVNVPRKTDFEAVTGDVTVSYKFAPDVMGYVRVATGDKAGGYNTLPNAALASVPFDPQKVTAYEVGLKSEFFDRRVRLNAAAYYNDYKDQQVQSAIPNPANPASILVVTANAASSEIPGVEVELTAVATDQIQVRASYAYIDAEIGEYVLGPGQPISTDITGLPIPRSPKNVFNVGATFSDDVGPGRLTASADYYYSDSYTNEFQRDLNGNLRLARVGSRGLANVTAAYDLGDWEISAYVRNLFNKKYFSGMGIANAQSYAVATPGEPRTFEMTIKRRF